MREYSMTLPVYYLVNKKKAVMVGLNWARNVHYAVWNKAKIFYKNLVVEDLKGEPMIEGDVEVVYHIYVKRSNADGGNVGAMMSKFFLDGAEEAGIIPNDTIMTVKKETFYYYQDKKFPRCEVTIKPYQDE
jgi:hypothetical protein